MQRLGGQGLAVEIETATELRGEMLGIGGTASVAGKPDLSACFQGIHTKGYGFPDGFEKGFVIENELFCCDGILNGFIYFQKVIIHGVNFKQRYKKTSIFAAKFLHTMKFYDLDDVFTFGKYEGMTIAEVYQKDPKYIKYCEENIDEFYVSPSLKRDLKSLGRAVSDSALLDMDFDQMSDDEIDAFMHHMDDDDEFSEEKLEDEFDWDNADIPDDSPFDEFEDEFDENEFDEFNDEFGDSFDGNLDELY